MVAKIWIWVEESQEVKNLKMFYLLQQHEQAALPLSTAEQLVSLLELPADLQVAPMVYLQESLSSNSHGVPSPQQLLLLI